MGGAGRGGAGPFAGVSGRAWAGPSRIRVGPARPGSDGWGGWGGGWGGGACCGRGRRRPGPPAGPERDPAGEGRTEATHCGHQVLQGPAEPHSAAEAQLQVLQGGAEARGHLGRSYPGDRGLRGASPALPASALPPEAFLLSARARAKRTHSDRSAGTCAQGVCPGSPIHPQCSRPSAPHRRLTGPRGGAALNKHANCTAPVATSRRSPTVDRSRC